MRNTAEGTPLPEMTEETTGAKKSVVDQVVESLIQDLIDGRLAPGDRIPTEPELCKKLGAGRNSVREAVKKLEAYGVVHIRRADGTFICEHYTQKMLDPILYSIILQKNSWADFVELRRVIDIGTLHVVTARADTPHVLEELEETLAEMETALRAPHPDITFIMDCDTRFHNLITQATGNPQLETITDYITRLTIPSRMQTLAHVLEIGEAENLVTLHRQLLEILRTRRTDAIDTAVSDHYIYWK